jgi:hypothetical protein
VCGCGGGGGVRESIHIRRVRRATKYIRLHTRVHTYEICTGKISNVRYGCFDSNAIQCNLPAFGTQRTIMVFGAIGCHFQFRCPMFTSRASPRDTTFKMTLIQLPIPIPMWRGCATHVLTWGVANGMAEMLA